jgi:hypothetical protein
MAIPAFRPDGYLPVGVHVATEGEVAERFGRSTERRRSLMARIAGWLQIARAVRARRFVLDGSFVTIKPDPNDVDCVCLLPADFENQYQSGVGEAPRLYEMLVTRQP